MRQSRYYTSGNRKSATTLTINTNNCGESEPVKANKLQAYLALTRLNRPIGTYLLMWPMLWAFWFASEGRPHWPTVFIFLLGTVLTRSAGCAINDYADRDFDSSVKRTKNRPLATGALEARDALKVTAVLMALAFMLVLLTNKLTISLSFLAVTLAIVYPFCKRYTHYPQVVLGAAFACAIPMAFAAQTNTLPALAWWLFLAATLWAMAYDTLYAMADRADDLAIGLKSTAIAWGRYDLLFVGILQMLVLLILAMVGLDKQRGAVFAAGLCVAAGFAIYQLWISRHRDPARCLQAFLNNNWLGMSIFIALFVDYLIYP